MIQGGPLYRLGPAWQHVSDGARETVILAWWGPRQFGSGAPRVWLAAVDPGARYRDDATGTEHEGDLLLRMACHWKRKLGGASEVPWSVSRLCPETDMPSQTLRRSRF